MLLAWGKGIFDCQFSNDYLVEDCRSCGCNGDPAMVIAGVNVVLRGLWRREVLVCDYFGKQYNIRIERQVSLSIIIF